MLQPSLFRYLKRTRTVSESYLQPGDEGELRFTTPTSSSLPPQDASATSANSIASASASNPRVMIALWICLPWMSPQLNQCLSIQSQWWVTKQGVSPKTGTADTISLSTTLRRMQPSVRCAGTLVSGAGRRSLARLDTGTGSSSIPLV